LEAGGSSEQEDPLVVDAFERSCFGLLSTAAQLPIDPTR